MRVESPRREPITTVADWERLAPPKSRDQWVEGRSAYELAQAWCGSGMPAMPEVVRALLDSRDETRGLDLEVAYAEHRIPFDSLGGEPRNADLAFVGLAGLRKVAVTVEAKADEAFGGTVGATIAAGLERGIKNPTSNAVRRVEGLVQALLRPWKKGLPGVEELRYQLLTAVAGTLAYAESQGAPIAVFIVHEFVTDRTDDARHSRNAADFGAFLQRVSGSAQPVSAPSQLLGPFSVPGGALFHGGRSLYIGKVTTNRRLKKQIRSSHDDSNVEQAPRPEPRFSRYVGIDYSGAEVATASLKGLRVCLAGRSSEPVEVKPPPSPRKYWTRRGVAEWLVERLSENVPTIVGIDHGFSFPVDYFQKYGLRHDWSAFLEDFCIHWPTDGDQVSVDLVRSGEFGNGAARMGSTHWRRVTEKHAGPAKSLFHFDVQGSVAKSTHSGLPWLRYLRDRVGPKLHFWPFDGWECPPGASVVVEVYPRLWNRQFIQDPGHTPDLHDAWVCRRVDAARRRQRGAPSRTPWAHGRD